MYDGVFPGANEAPACTRYPAISDFGCFQVTQQGRFSKLFTFLVNYVNLEAPYWAQAGDSNGMV